MSDASPTFVRRWPGSSRAGILLHVSFRRNFADRKSRGSGFRLSWLLCALLLVFAAATELCAETTIYVGKHFEIRDHDAPVKYVFNGSTRVARITGSLSTNTRIQRFRLRSGWNSLSLAVTAPNALRQLTNSQFSILNSQSVVRWDHATLNWLHISSEETLPAGSVLWINATSNAIISVVGTYSDPVNRDVSAGATYLATTGLEAWTPSFPPTMSAWSFDPQPSTLNPQPTWLARLTGDISSINELPRTFAPGDALYVIANAPYQLEVPDPTLRIRYYHQDHLGSSSVMTDANGALVEGTAFYPFGIPRHEHRIRQIEESYKFTQKERDRESGLHYFEARYLAGAMSRFLSVDPKYANTESAQGDPQAQNLYAYVRNNPLQYTDPTGLDQRSEIANAAALHDTRAARDDESTLLQIGRFSANIVAGAADALPIEGGLNRSAALFKATGMADTDSGVYKVSYWTTTVGSFFIPVGGAANATRVGGRVAVEGATVAPKVGAVAAEGGIGAIPARIYRGATQNNPAHVALREGETAVSFRASMSNPLPARGTAPQPVLKPGRNYIEVDTSRLPPGSVIPDGGRLVNGQRMPHGHVSVYATIEQIINATVGGGKLPK